MSQFILLALLLGIAVVVMAMPSGDRDAPPAVRRPPRRLEVTSKGWHRSLAFAVLAVIAAGAMAVLVYEDDAPPVACRPVVAVLPLASVGSQEPYVAAGITEELTTRLGGLNGLQMASVALALQRVLLLTSIVFTPAARNGS